MTAASEKMKALVVYDGSTGKNFSQGYSSGFADGYGQGLCKGSSDGFASGFTHGISKGSLNFANGFAKGYAQAAKGCLYVKKASPQRNIIYCVSAVAAFQCVGTGLIDLHKRLSRSGILMETMMKIKAGPVHEFENSWADLPW